VSWCKTYYSKGSRQPIGSEIWLFKRRWESVIGNPAVFSGWVVHEDSSMELIANYKGTNYYLADVSQDTFVHFTLSNRARAIQQSGSLLGNSPFGGTGIAGVQAVSTTFGKHVPGVQYTHLNSPDVVAIAFKTTAQPKVGHVEEVIWPGDVPVSDLKIMDLASAISMLHGTDDEICVIYDPNHPWIEELKKRMAQEQSPQISAEAWVRRNCKFSV